jgi:GDPmannose 4,6-dehydratase
MGGKVALITGVTGQDGAYLARLLLGRGYCVHGLRRPSSTRNIVRIEDLCENFRDSFFLHHGDIVDASGLIRLIRETEPDEIYNLAAQSHVHVSFDAAKYTANCNGLGVLRLLEAIRLLGLEHKVRFYQASTSELFGHAQEVPQRETTPFYPRSPYAVAKLYGHWIVVNYREAYGMHASNGILFNHESPIRGDTFVTRKISRAAAAIRLGLQQCLHLGNLDAQRDWGHARDYVEGMWLMLQQDDPDDYVLATGVATRVRTFVEWAFEEVGIAIAWRGSGADEEGIDVRTGKAVVAVDPRFLRPADVDHIVGDATKARTKLGWSPRVTARELAAEMVMEDLKAMRAAVATRDSSGGTTG